MFYTKDKKSFKSHIHPKLQKRIRIFLIMGSIMFAFVIWDIVSGIISLPIAFISVVVGSIVGLITSRIFHLSWNNDGENILARIDTLGWFVLGGYIIIEIARAIIFETVIHLSVSTTTAITFSFVSSALLGRVFGLRGRILKILKEEKVFG